MPETVFHSPPGWPEMPVGFLPGSQWRPQEHWGAAPPGWVFYTRSGQPASPPDGLWDPEQTYVPTPVSTAPNKPPRPAGDGRRWLLLISAAAVVLVLVAAVLIVRSVVGKEPVVTSTQFASLIPQGTVLGGVEVGDVQGGRSTDPDINGPDGSGGTCLSDLVQVAGAGAEVTLVRGGSMGVDPTTGLIDGNELRIWATRMPDVDQARQRYDQLRKAREQLDCFTGPEQQQMVPGKKLAQRKQSPRWEIYGDGARSASYSLLQRGNVLFVVSAAKARAASDAEALNKEIAGRVDLLGS